MRFGKLVPLSDGQQSVLNPLLHQILLPQRNTETVMCLGVVRIVFRTRPKARSASSHLR